MGARGWGIHRDGIQFEKILESDVGRLHYSMNVLMPQQCALKVARWQILCLFFLTIKNKINKKNSFARDRSSLTA